MDLGGMEIMEESIFRFNILEGNFKDQNLGGMEIMEKSIFRFEEISKMRKNSIEIDS